MKLLITLCLFWLSSNLKTIKNNPIKYVAVIEGFGSNCSATNNNPIHSLKDQVTVRCLSYKNPLSSIIGAVVENVQYMCEQLKEFAKCKRKIYLVCYSQGGFLGFLLLTMCREVKITRFAAIGSPLLGTDVANKLVSPKNKIAKPVSKLKSLILKNLPLITTDESRENNISKNRDRVPFIYLRPNKDELPTSDLFTTAFNIRQFWKGGKLHPFEELEKVALY